MYLSFETQEFLKKYGKQFLKIDHFVLFFAIFAYILMIKPNFVGQALFFAYLYSAIWYNLKFALLGKPLKVSVVFISLGILPALFLGLLFLQKGV